MANRWISTHEFRGKIIKEDSSFDINDNKILTIWIEYEDTQDVHIIRITQPKEVLKDDN